MIFDNDGDEILKVEHDDVMTWERFGTRKGLVTRSFDVFFWS